MAPSRSLSRGIGAVAALALVVGLAAALRGPTPQQLPDGVWGIDTPTFTARIGIWSGYLQYWQAPVGQPWKRRPDDPDHTPIYYAEELSVAGIPVEGNGRIAFRAYERVGRDWGSNSDTTELRFELGKPMRLPVVEGGKGSWWVIREEGVHRLRRVSTGPRPIRFAIRTGPCFGSCSVMYLQVDARGHVEYEGVRNVSRIGRFVSDDGADLFRTLELTAAVVRPDSIFYGCQGVDGQHARLVTEYEDGRSRSHYVMMPCGAFYLFAAEVYRLLPTLALTPTTRPHRFATDSDEER